MKSCAASTLDEASRFWVPDAEEKLQALIDGADDRNDLIRIAREIDFWLARNPLDFGEPHFETVRLGVVRPRAVLFEVLEEPPTVIVLEIWRFRDVCLGPADRMGRVCAAP